MGRIAILGAGFMGSALSIPASDNGHAVALWGTHLDSHIIEALRAGRAHPKLKLPLPVSVTPFAWAELAAALEGADMVILAVTSEGAVPVLERAHGLMRPDIPLLVASKGLVPLDGRVSTLSTAIRTKWAVCTVTIGGPSKAVELARRAPTEVTYASPDAQARQQARRWMETPYYCIHESTDQQGLELCSALKNAYAIAVGLCDGLVAAGRAGALYNLKAALFSHAVEEMKTVGRYVDIHPQTFYGLGGVGDLFVTAVAGRNRTFGEMRGSGLPTTLVVERLRARDELTEGYAAIRWCWRFAQDHAVADHLPLLRAIYRVVYEEADPARELTAACFSR
ncbi:MAG: glycerol-3-phosphate dehydrogenase [Armatimonadota bacterium]|nr:glycerol-3-phosphate dehydrogenase [Armatimonadota bacterium]